MAEIKMEVKADISEVSALLEELFAKLADVPDEVRELLLDVSNISSELLVESEFLITSSATATIRFKPSKFLIDFSAAVRTGNFDSLFVEYPHVFSSVGNGSVELPSLPTLGKLNSDAEGI